MARTNSVNFTGANQFPIASAGTDIFKKEDVQVATKSLDLHTHGAGLGAPVDVSALAAGAIDGSKLTDNTVTSAKIADGTIVAADIADAGITNAKLGPDVARANLLTNGGFEIWQRGNGPLSTNGQYTCDRFALSLVGTDTLSVSRDTANVDIGSTYCAACTFTLGTGAGGTAWYQPLGPDQPQLKGRTLSASVRIKTATANAVRLNFYTNGTGGAMVSSAYHSGSGAYQTLTVTNSIPSDATTFNFAIGFAASCVAYIDNAMLVVGSQPANYAPLHPADDLARCLRYYEILGEGAGEIAVTGYQAAGQPIDATLSYHVRKAVTPTITKNGAWGVLNCGQPGTNGGYVNSVVLRITATASGTTSAVNNAGGANVTIEANP